MEEPRDQVKGGSGHCFCPGSVAAAPPRISEEGSRPEDGSKSDDCKRCGRNASVAAQMKQQEIENPFSDLIFLQ